MSAYLILPNPLITRPSARALAPRRERIEDAVADMGPGIVVDESGRLVAFHERHLDLVVRRAEIEARS